MSIRWCFGFPYCPNEQIRAEAFEAVTAFYTRHFPDVPTMVHSATAVGEPFLRARTRNELVMQAQGFDLIVLIDADTLIHPAGIGRMLNVPPMTLGKPHRQGVNVPLEHQRSLDPNGWPRGRFEDPGAAWVIRPRDWACAGGMDEAFTSWGGEDAAFEHMFVAVGGTVVYDRHAAVKTLHEQSRRTSPDYPETLKRELVYRHIRFHPELAKEWLEVRHQPGIVDEWATRHSIRLPARYR